MRLPSVAVPHSMPPSEAPGPTGVLHTMLPSSGLSAQKMPLFWPKPTILPTRFGPAPPRSKSGLLGTGQFGISTSEEQDRISSAILSASARRAAFFGRSRQYCRRDSVLLLRGRNPGCWVQDNSDFDLG